MTTTHNPSDARMTAQAPYESLTSVADVQRALREGRAVEVEAFAGAWLVVPHTATLADIKCDMEDHEHRFRAALPERAPVSAGGDAVGVMDLSAPPRVWLQVDTDGDPDDRSEAIPPEAWDQLTWHYEPIGGQEVVYVRQDLATPAEARGVGDGLAAQLAERNALIERLTARIHDGAQVDEAMVARAMSSRIPGGSEAWAWLFNCEGGMAPEDKHREWFRRVLTAALAANKPAGEDDGVRVATPEEEAEIDRAAGLVKLVLRLPSELHARLDSEAKAYGCVLPAFIRHLLGESTDTRQAQAQGSEGVGNG